jgi:acetyltransferase-like isoleucine patch superfamily enzyme
VIEDDVLIGARCIILKGVSIGARSIIGAGSIVVKNIPEDCIAAGNPCVVIIKLCPDI